MTHFTTSSWKIKQWNTEQFLILIPSFVLVVVVICIGIPGNIVTICVYLRKMRHTASRIFILALALCDLSNCLLTMPVEISIIVRYWSYDFPVICSIGHTLTYILNGVSALLLCGIAVDRFRKICRPLKPVFTPKTVKFICTVAFLVGTVFYIPGFFLYGTQTVYRKLPSGDILVGKICQICDKYKDSKVGMYILGVWFLGTLSVMVVLIVLYSLIGRAVFRRLRLEEKRRGSLSSAPKPKPKLRRLAADDMSETSCSFNEDSIVRASPSKGQQTRVLKTLSTPAKDKLASTLKEKFRKSAPGELLFRKSTNNMASRRIRAGRTTVMLFSVTIAYIVSFLPFVVIVILRVTIPTLYLTLSNAEKSAWHFFLRSYVINCAVNPILYGLFNKDFRQKMRELICSIVTCK